MKKLLLILVAIAATISVNAQTAVNFNCADCTGTMHDLFTECDNGNVVVLLWVMPCGACISGGLTCSNVTATYPSNVNFYMVDDAANTVCTSLGSWANSNNIHPDATFSNATIKMSDYGATGMPKAVVIGGTSHTVFYNANNTVNPTALQNAINQALTIASIGDEPGTPLVSMSVYPSPAIYHATVKFSADKQTSVIIELYNLQGEKLQNVNANAIAGQNEVAIDIDGYAAGTYLVKLTAGQNSRYSNLIVSH